MIWVDSISEHTTIFAPHHSWTNMAPSQSVSGLNWRASITTGFFRYLGILPTPYCPKLDVTAGITGAATGATGTGVFTLTCAALTITLAAITAACTVWAAVVKAAALILPAA